MTRFYDRSGETSIHTAIDPLGEERRWLRLEDLPKFVGDATLVAENQGHVISAAFDPVHSMIRVWRYMLGVSLTTKQASSAAWRKIPYCPTRARADWISLCCRWR